MTSPPLDVSGDTPTRQLLAYLSAGLVAGGMPAHEVTEEVRRAARALGVPNAQVAVTPTHVMIALDSGGPSTVELVEGGLRLDQLAEVNAICAGLQTGRLRPAEALAQLGVVRARPHRYNRLGLYLGGVCSGMGIALILQPTWRAVLFAALLSPVVMGLVRLSARQALVRSLLPSVAAFAVGTAAFIAAQQGWAPGPLRTMLPPLAVLLPGGLIVTGLSELAAASMVAGVSRLAYGTCELLLFALGVGGAVALTHPSTELLTNRRYDDFGLVGAVVGVALVTIGIALMESVPRRLLPVIFAVIAATFGCQVAGQAWLHEPRLGALLGATAASFGASVIEFVRPQVSRIVIFLPSFWLLVPGSLGLLSVTQIGNGQGTAGETLVLACGMIVCIALGVVIGSSLALSVRSMSRRVHVREALKGRGARRSG